jgi:ABC-type multidrug transport system ATPase subunit
MEPQVLIMDEPLGGLDEEGQRWISDCIHSLKREDRMIILATHNRSLADSLADRFLTMNRNHELSAARDPHLGKSCKY